MRVLDWSSQYFALLSLVPRKRAFLLAVAQDYRPWISADIPHKENNRITYVSHCFLLHQAIHQQPGAKRSHPPRACRPSRSCESPQEIRTKVNRALSLGPSEWAGSITLPLIYHSRGIVSRNWQGACRYSEPVFTPSSLHKGLERLGSGGPMPLHARWAFDA